MAHVTRRGPLAGVALAASASFPAMVAAQSPAAEDLTPTTLSWALPEEPCLSAVTFQEAVRQALGREPFTDDARADTLRVSEVSRDARSVKISIELRRGQQALGTREVEVSLHDCNRTRETVAVVSAMLIEAPREPPAPPPPPTPPTPTPPPPPPPARRVAPETKIPIVVEAAVLATTGKGYLPRRAVGVRAEVTARIGKLPLLRAAAGANRGATIESNDGRVQFRAVEYSLGVAPLSLPLGPRASVFAFGAASLTGVIAHASNFEVSRSETRWIAGAVAGVALRLLPFDRGLVVTVEAQGFVPFARPRFTVVDSLDPTSELELHRVAPAGFDASLGVGYQFR